MAKGKDSSGKVKMDTAFDKSSSKTPGNAPAKLKGSCSDLGHSISGATAHQGRSTRGKSNGFD